MREFLRDLLLAIAVPFIAIFFGGWLLILIGGVFVVLGLFGFAIKIALDACGAMRRLWRPPSF